MSLRIFQARRPRPRLGVDPQGRPARRGLRALPPGRWQRFRRHATGRLPRLAAVGALLALGLWSRVTLARGQTLWVDEIFSLAMATGHSLEHSAAAARPDLGDFVEPTGPEPPSTFLRYVQPGPSPAGPGRVVRAVLLSDTNPPLYYLVLAAWARLAGTSDLALRSLSILLALACAPLLWSVARAVGGRRTARAALVLFTFAPVGAYYATEGRMYALVWLLSLILAWSSLRLRIDGPRPAILAIWVLSGTAGFLTHYFFAFTWLACVAYLAIEPGRLGRPRLAAAAIATLVAVLPWYLRVPESLELWRVTGTWLTGELGWLDILLGPPILAWSLISGHGPWGGFPWPDRAGALLVLILGGVLFARGPGWLFRGRRKLPWLWLAAACLGPLVFDLLRHTTASQISRYAVTAFPAGILLLALGAARLEPVERAAFLALYLLSWAPNLVNLVTAPNRGAEPYRAMERRLAAWTGAEDLVIVHSIPSGVIAVSRYAVTRAPLAAWVGQLGQRRVPDDVRALAAGRRRVAVLRIHEVATPAPEEAWLRRNARVVAEHNWPVVDPWNTAHIVVFAPAQGEAF